MGLDMGIISVTYLNRPRGRVYEFAWELAVEASTTGYMHGEGYSWGHFTRTRIRQLLQGFARVKKLSRSEIDEVRSWVESLPWDGDNTELYFDW